MIIYNVTLSIHPEIESEVIHWLKNEHIPEVMATQLFMDYNLFKVLEHPGAEHNSYAVQYKLSNWEMFHEYQSKFADALRQKTQERYGENVLAFRTFLESVD